MGAKRTSGRGLFLGVGRRRGGFTLLEVVIALGLLAFGSVSIIGLYMNNARDAIKARDEVILAVLMNDIRTKCRLAAYFAFEPADPSIYPSGFKSTFDREDWLPRGKRADGSAAPDVYAVRKITRKGEAAAWLPSGAVPTTDEVAFNEQLWEHPADASAYDGNGVLKSSVHYEDLKGVKARYDFLAGDPAHYWDANPIYQGFQFRLRTVLPPEWENNQYVDWDGYGYIKENEIGFDLDGNGKIDNYAKPFYDHNHPNDAADGTPFARPSHGVVYDPRGMRFYVKRIKCIIGYRLADPKTTRPAPSAPGDKKRGIYSGSYHIFTFSINNPNTWKK